MSGGVVDHGLEASVTQQPPGPPPWPGRGPRLWRCEPPPAPPRHRRAWRLGTPRPGRGRRRGCLVDDVGQAIGETIERLADHRPVGGGEQSVECEPVAVVAPPVAEVTGAIGLDYLVGVDPGSSVPVAPGHDLAQASLGGGNLGVGGVKLGQDVLVVSVVGAPGRSHVPPAAQVRGPEPTISNVRSI